MLFCRKQATTGSRIAFFLFVLLLSLISYYGMSFLSFHWKKNMRRFVVGQQSKHPCEEHGNLTDATITPLRDKNTFILAPYLDNRSGTSIRVLSIVHHEKVKELYCIFCCQSESKIKIVKAEIDVHEDRFEFPYGLADLLCTEPQGCDSQILSVHPSNQSDLTQLPLFQIKNLHPERPSLSFTVCISAMFGEYNNVLQFVQSVEMYKILGAQKVMIYKNSCSQTMEKVLDYYISEGIVEIIPWPIHLYLQPSTHWHHSMEAKDIGYYGQIAALNDCIYHNMYRSRYVVLIDADEVILPVQDADWKSLMQRLEKENPGVGVFLFENHVFGNSLFSTTPFNFSSWDTVPGVNIIGCLYRQPDFLPAVRNRKMIVDPRKLFRTSVHHVLNMYGDPVLVPSNLAISFHCKIPLRKDFITESIIPNKLLWRYSDSLIPNVDQVLHKSNVILTQL